MDELRNWYENLTYGQIDAILVDNIANVKRAFIAIGYYLKYSRDHELYFEGGYESVWEYAKERFGIERTTASRWMAINDKFSKDGNSPILAEQYQEFGKGQLQEMLYLTDDQLEEVTTDMTVKDIREVRKPEPVEEEPEENTVCDIAQDVPFEESSIDELDFSVNTYNVLRRAGIDTIKELIQMSDDDLARIRSFSRRNMDEVHKKLEEYGYRVPEEECATSHIEESEEVAVEDDTEQDDFVVESAKSVIKEEESVVDHTEIVVEQVESEKYEEISGLSDLDIVKQELDKENRTLELMLKEFTENDIRIRKQKLLVVALAAYSWDLDEILNAQPEPEQPELLILRNNDQRKAFIDAYEDWPVWIDNKDTGERYYRYDFENGASFVVKVYFHRCFDYSMECEYKNWEDRYKPGFGSEEYYILVDGKYFKDCLANKSALVEYLKNIQKA